MKTTLWKRMLIILLLIFLIFSFILFVLLIVIMFREKSTSKEYKTNIYRFSELDPISNTANHGFVNLAQGIEENEFLSYKVNGGKTGVISNFFDDEYECTGSCYCLDGVDEELQVRRSLSSNMLDRGMFIALSAISAFVAYNIAKETFQNGCEQKYSDVCKLSQIITDVGNCEEIPQIIDRPSEDISESLEEEYQRRFYECSGYCVDNKHHTWQDTSQIDEYRDENLKEARRGFGDCESLKMSGSVDIVVANTVQKVRDSNNIARSKFAQKHLTGYCQSQSKVEFTKVWSPVVHQNNKEYKYVYKQIKDTSACVASGLGGRYPNVKCYLQKKEYFVK